LGILADLSRPFSEESPMFKVNEYFDGTVKLPDASDWETFAAGSQFNVPANSKFQLKVAVDTAYLCEYRG
jgi:uncharacterized protein YaiE (UPF0345 family)